MRFIFSFFLLSLLIIGCEKDGKNHVPLYEYVPANAAIVVKINDLSALRDSLRANRFLGRLENLEPYGSILANTAFLDSLPHGSSGILVVSKTEKDSAEIVYISNILSNAPGPDSLKASTLEALAPENDEKFSINGKDLYAKTRDDRLFIGTSKGALSKISSREAGKAGPSFLRLYHTSDEKQIGTVFMNMARNDSLLSPSFREKLLSPATFTDWMALDVAAGRNQLALNGLSITRDSVSNYLNLFRNTRPVPNLTPSFAPLQADGVLSYSFGDIRIFSANQQNYLKRTTAIDSLFNAVEEIGLVYLGAERAVVLNTYGSEDMAGFLAGIGKGAYDYQGNTIAALAENDFLNDAFEPIIANFEANHFTILENAFVFGQNQEILKTIIENFKKGTTFDKSPTYRIAGSALTSSATISFICGAAHLERILREDLKSPLYNNLKKQKLSGYVFTAQIVADGPIFLTNMAAQKTVNKSASPGVRKLFTLPLEGAAANDPQFVMNHNTKKREIVVQDDANILYLISGEGKVLWKKALTSKVQGRIHQVDLFKNGRLQLAFTTHDQLMVLDRNGKEVKMLTKLFEGGNLNPLAVFDYEEKREYRLVVTQGDHVYMYDRKGKIVEGFKFKEADQPILDAPRHMVIGSKDYLVFKLEGGGLKILSRTGNVRVPVREKFDFSENGVQLYKNQFTLTDAKGVLPPDRSEGKNHQDQLKPQPRPWYGCHIEHPGLYER